MVDAAHPFTPGTEVLVHSQYSHYHPGTFRNDTVLKIHKSGRFTLAGEPSKQWSAQRGSIGDDNEWLGWPTARGGYSIYSTRLRLVSEKAKAEMAEAQALRAHEERCRKLEKVFGNPKNITRELSAAIVAMLSEGSP